MKTERPERKKTFNEMLNKLKNVVVDELMFIVTYMFLIISVNIKILFYGLVCILMYSMIYFFTSLVIKGG